MERLINIDNGGTLTDICVWDGQDFTFTKTLTTPFDLSKCLFDGITKASERVFGAADLEALLHSTRHIRYSTTQGTNALVERKGPRIGLITDSDTVVAELRSTASEAGLFDDLIGHRVALIDPNADEETLNFDLVQRVNKLTTDGASRIVVAVGDGTGRDERRLRSILLRRFPRHLLGSVPILYSWEFTSDRRRSPRIWSAVINAFLHPTMERFLYNTEDRLRAHRVQNPLLIYRNDGASSRVAKSVALKTYSSGPRGGLEGTRALARAYDLPHVLMIDVGGTTTDVGSVKDFQIAVDRRGSIKGVPISFPMSDVHLGRRRWQLDHHRQGRRDHRRPRECRRRTGSGLLRVRRQQRHDHRRQPAAGGAGPGDLPRRRVHPGRRAVQGRHHRDRRGAAGDQPRGGPDPHGSGLFHRHGRGVRPGHRRPGRHHDRRVRRRRPDERLRRGTAHRRANRARPETGRGLLRLRDQLLRHRPELRGGPCRADRRSGRGRARLAAGTGRA